MNTAQAYQTYSQNNININSNDKLVLMLYEGILKFTTFAKKAIQVGDVEKRVQWINRSIDIFSELSNTLNIKEGGEVAEYLQGLYNHQIVVLTRANIENNEEHLDTVIRVARGLMDAWREVTSSELG